MQDLTNNPHGYLRQLTGQRWNEVEDMFVFSSNTKEKITQVTEKLNSVGISFLVNKTKSKEVDLHFIHVTKQQVASLTTLPPLQQAPKTDLKPLIEEKYSDKFSLLEKQNKVFRPDEFDRSVPNRFPDDEQCQCVRETMLKTTGDWERPLHIHANHVDLDDTSIHVICSQAPMEENEGDFWNAVIDTSALVLDLTNSTDRQSEEIQRYFPFEVGTSMTFDGDDITVSCVDEKKAVDGNKKLKLHTYTVKRVEAMVDQEVLCTARRLHYRGWPDHGAIQPTELATIVRYVRTNKQMLEHKPLWIHCRAGVGRSGTVAVALGLVERYKEGELTADTYEEIINQLIQSGRRQRNNWFVQTVYQYKLLHEFAMELITGSITID